MVVSNDVVAEPELAKSVATYLQRSAEAARVMLPNFQAAIVDSIAGDDDSDGEE